MEVLFTKLRTGEGGPLGLPQPCIAGPASLRAAAWVGHIQIKICACTSFMDVKEGCWRTFTSICMSSLQRAQTNLTF